MKKILVLLLIGMFLVGCTNVKINTEKKETTTSIPIPKEENTQNVNITPQQVIDATVQEITIEDFGDII